MQQAEQYVKQIEQQESEKQLRVEQELVKQKQVLVEVEQEVVKLTTEARRRQEVAVIEASFNWDDVGSWTSLERLRGKNDDGNTLVGKCATIETSNSILRSEGDHLVATDVVSRSGLVHRLSVPGPAAVRLPRLARPVPRTRPSSAAPGPDPSPGSPAPPHRAC